jgi:hypothetical protein
MNSRGVLGDIVLGFCLGVGGHVGWGIVGWLIGVIANAVK